MKKSTVLSIVAAANFAANICIGLDSVSSTQSEGSSFVSSSAPILIHQPANVVADFGANVTFRVVANGSSLKYQWKKNGEDLKDYANVFGAQTAALKLIGVAQGEAADYTVEIRNATGSVTSTVAKLTVQSTTVFFDNFEFGSTNWLSFSQENGASISTERNTTPGGAKSLVISNSHDKVYHNLGVKLAGRVRATFWIYDNGQADSRCYGELRGHTGRGHAKYVAPGGMKQLLAIGCFPDQTIVKNAGSVTNEQPNTLKYQARVLRGTNTGWFNLSDAPDRSAGWHKFEIERDPDGTTIHFYVDGILGRTITDADHVFIDCVVIGATGTGNAPSKAWFDDVIVESFPKKYDWRSKDSDGKGLFDWMKLRETGEDPASTNIVAINTVVESVGSTANRLFGQWKTDGEGIYAVDRRGYVEYSIDLPFDDAYRIEIEGRERNNKVPIVEIPLIVSVDGENLGRFPLRYSATANGFVHCFTPFLQAGPHTIRIYWDNAASRTSLYLRAVRWQTLSAADANSNGFKDWVENRVLSQSGLDSVPTASRVSPVCLEGRGHHLSLIKLTSGTSEMTAPVDLRPGPADRWYADVPLSSTGLTIVNVSYESGVLEETTQIAWEPTNLLDSGDTMIRKGDALLFTATPAGASNGTVTINVSGVTNYISGAATPVEHRFEQSGIFDVIGTFEPTGVSRVIKVKVVEASFDGPVAAWVGKRRFWDSTNLPPEVIVEGDPRLKFVQVPKAERDLQIPKPLPLGVNGRQYSITTDEIGSRVVVARLGVNGPILASTSVVGFRLYNGMHTYLKQVAKLDDGSELIETAFILSPVLPEVSVRLKILVSGVTFADGTISKTLNAGDFNELGECPVQFIRAQGVKTSICHSTKAYQGGNLIGWPGNPK